MHMPEGDPVPFKIALRHLSERLKNEAIATELWANLAKNRGFTTVAVRLEDAVSSLKTAFVNCEAALDRLSEEHEISATEKP